MNGRRGLIIGAARSGGGKTTLTLGILAALVRRGVELQPFKIGPDFIDPSLHRMVTGTVSYNLDRRMMGDRCCQTTFWRKSEGAELSILEGVMGLFDGGEASTAAMARLLGLPVCLVIDAASCAESAIAILKGFVEYDPQLRIAGVIFNQIGSERHQLLIERELQRRLAIPAIGYMVRRETFAIGSRHLGLLMGEERPLDQDNLQELAETVESRLDLELLLSQCTAGGDPTLLDHLRPPKGSSRTGPSKRLAVARDEAFSFYYQQNLELLEAAGFEIVYFSPLHDRRIPEACELVYFGGGYPELHAGALAANTAMLRSVRRLHREGTQIYGECGGFMYLCRFLVDSEGNRFELAGLFGLETTMDRRLRKLGYRRARLQRDCLLGLQGAVLHGHEFHYSHISSRLENRPGRLEPDLYRLDNSSHEGYSSGSAVGSYIHLHLGGTPEAAARMFDYAGSAR